MNWKAGNCQVKTQFKTFRICQAILKKSVSKTCQKMSRQNSNVEDLSRNFMTIFRMWRISKKKTKKK